MVAIRRLVSIALVGSSKNHILLLDNINLEFYSLWVLAVRKNRSTTKSIKENPAISIRNTLRNPRVITAKPPTRGPIATPTAWENWAAPNAAPCLPAGDRIAISPFTIPPSPPANNEVESRPNPPGTLRIKWNSILSQLDR